MPLGGEGIYLVVDEQGKFNEENFQKAIFILSEQQDKIMQTETKKKKLSSGTELSKLVKMIIKKHYDPCILFSFSKRNCEAFALTLSEMDFNTPDEKAIIEKIYTNAMKTLSEEDQQLPMIKSMLPMLKRGIGIHHGGLLPIVKEVIEILF
jgi:ATP-dependent RNA helicase DOB1